MLLIDGGYVFFGARAPLIKAVKYPALYNCPRMIRKIIEVKRLPFIVAWNHSILRKRKIFPEYRKPREEPWDVGREDFNLLLKFLNFLGVVQFRDRGWEADEVIAALANRLKGRREVIILGNDKDFNQLLGGKVWMWDYIKGKEIRYKDARKKYGVSPKHFADYLALIGDPADNIPRILSNKEAADVLKKKGNISKWIDTDIGGIDIKLSGKILENRNRIKFNLRLTDLSKIKGKPNKLKVGGFGDWDRARRMGKKYDLQYFVKKPEDFNRVRDLGKEAVKVLRDIRISSMVRNYMRQIS